MSASYSAVANSVVTSTDVDLGSHGMSHSIILCPSCGSKAKASDAYCSECGFPMSQVRAEEGAADTLVGKSLAGGYRIVEPLAEGSMGRVYRAEQSNLGRAVAVKVMSQGLVSNPEMVERFRNEARAASLLNHPNCVRVYDFGQTPDGRPYFVMELLTGQDLEAVLAHEPLQPVTRVLDISLQILSALEEAHGLDVVHRDLKPANVFVLPQRGGGDLVKVVDFGLAKLRSGMSTPGGLVFGTPEYITPEQATAKETDQRTDLYACGVMLFEMVSGRLPFLAKDARELLEKHVFEEPPKLGDINADRSIFGLDLVVERAMKKKPDERYQTAGEFADALREIVAHRTGERSSSDRKSWVRTAFRACQQCGNLNPPMARFCGECGETMDRESLTGVSASMIPPFIPQSDSGTLAKSDRPVSGTAPSLGQAGSPAPLAALAAQLAPTLSGRNAVAVEAQRSPEIAPPPGRQPSARPRRSEPPAALTESALASIRDAIAEAEGSGDPASALVFLEQIATARLKAGDARSAIEALRRGIDIARADLDKGELDDPIRVVAIFSSKLGECYLETQEFSMATRSLKDALALSRGGAERARIWLLLSRVARAQGHDGDSAEYLDAAEREAAGMSRRTSEPPSSAQQGVAERGQAANDSSRNR